MADGPVPAPARVPQNLDNSNEIILDQLKDCMAKLEEKLASDCLTTISPILGGLDDSIRRVIEARKVKRQKLSIILETDGGSIETAQRMADLFRHHYKQVDFIVPNYAMSAGTILAMSGDSIWMDYYATLGPIDPQMERPSGGLFPATGYLILFERLIEKSRKGTLTTAEMMYLVQSFNPAELYRYEQARELSIALLKEWLVRYKFKNWTKTETRKKTVTSQMRAQRARKVAEILSDTKRWNSHGRGISAEVLRRDVHLLIDDFGSDHDLNEKIGRYYRLLKDFIARIGVASVLHHGEAFVPLALG